MTSTFSDYGSRSSGGGTNSADQNQADGGLSLSKLKRQYLDYLSSKREEIDEQIDARRYRHGAQYTAKQIDALNKRGQPVVTYNRISRKIDGIVGLVEKMRQDPKAYPRTPKHEEGAELATAVIRYALDEQEWRAKSPICASDGATDGIGGLEITLEQGDRGDVEVGFDIVSPEDFFYDPRSFRLDFSDARYMGVGKWLDVDQAKDMFPDKADDLQASLEGSDLTSNSDKDQKWFSSDNGRVRVVEHWYIRGGEWHYCIYTGAMKLAEGKSLFVDEKGKTFCKYVMFSANVDHDGDRYGFIRGLKSAQDEINARRSKALHEAASRRIIADAGAFDDIEKARREINRPDGIVIKNPGLEATFDDAARIKAVESQLQFLADAKDEIENFGPNPALIGQGIENKSGRAIGLLQQAGIAELGPYILAYRGWKIRVYRALFNAIRQHWTAERWVRVTDDDGLAQFVQINGVQVDPMTGQSQLVNAIGSLDVDIILDEGPDAMNMMADSQEVLATLAQSGAPIPPQVFIELSPLQASVKKKVLDMLSQPNPMQQQAQQIELANNAAKVDETQSKTALNYARAMQAGQPPVAQQAFEAPPELQIAGAMAELDDKQAAARQKHAQAAKLEMETALAPQQMTHQNVMDMATLEPSGNQDF